jgi:hypothetical protein
VEGFEEAVATTVATAATNLSWDVNFLKEGGVE